VLSWTLLYKNALPWAPENKNNHKSGSLNLTYHSTSRDSLEAVVDSNLLYLVSSFPTPCKLRRYRKQEVGLKKWVLGWGFSSVVEHLPSERKALGSVPSSEKKKKKRKKKKWVLLQRKVALPLINWEEHWNLITQSLSSVGEWTSGATYLSFTLET